MDWYFDGGERPALYEFYFIYSTDCQERLAALHGQQGVILETKKLYIKNKTSKKKEKNTMASIVMVIGQSGTGKSTSLRNFKKGECSVINVSKKPMPFPCDLNVANVGNYDTIKTLLQKTEAPSIVIDDCTYLLVNEYMSKADERGYDKYTAMAKSFWDLLNFCINDLPDWKIVYFMGHTEKGDDGREHFKTVGKMLDNTVVCEGYCTVVFKTVVEDGKYYFCTHNNGYDTVKTPLGMFEADRIDNDLKAADVRMREYFKLPLKAPVENKKTETKENK